MTFLKSSCKVEKIGVSLPENIFNKIESERGDVSRSRFILRLLELGFKTKEEKAI